MPTDQLPTETLTKMPSFRSPGPIGTASALAVAARFARAIAGFMQSLLLALHESRFERARREINSLRHLIPTAKAVTGPRAAVPCSDQPARRPEPKPAEARREPSHVA
jgi:hypothetical protein